MSTHSSPSDGHSPNISAELFIHDQHFKLASMGSANIVIREPKSVRAGHGSIRLQIDQKVLLYQIELPQGINPELHDQPYLLLATADEMAA